MALLPTNVDASYENSPTDPTWQLHQQHHDALHAFHNKFDQDTPPADGDLMRWEAATQTWMPTTPAAVVANAGAAPALYARTAAQGVPTAAQCLALGLPDGTIITVDQT